MLKAGERRLQSLCWVTWKRGIQYQLLACMVLHRAKPWQPCSPGVPGTGFSRLPFFVTCALAAQPRQTYASKKSGSFQAHAMPAVGASIKHESGERTVLGFLKCEAL